MRLAGRQAWTFFPPNQNCLNHDLYDEMIDRIKESNLEIQISPLVEMTGGKSEGPIEGISLCWSCDHQTITPSLVGDNLPTAGRKETFIAIRERSAKLA